MRKPETRELPGVNVVLSPSLSLMAKLGSILVHVDEGAGAGGHEFDWAAVRSLIADPEVQDWLAAMREAGLLPVKRSRYAAIERASARHEQDCLWPLCDCGELEACRRDVKGGDPPGTRPKPART